MSERRLFLVMLAISCTALIRSSTLTVAKEKSKTKHVPILVSWYGTPKMDLMNEAPMTGYVADIKTWEKLWRAWRGDEQIPAVNFEAALVVVATNDDPNLVDVKIAVDDNGDLKLTKSTTLAYYRNPTKFSYHLALISRANIAAVEGQKIKQE